MERQPENSETACPSCGAAVRPDAPWCTLCYADLRPAPPVPPMAMPASAPLVAPPTAAYGPPAVDPLTAPLAGLLAVSRGGPEAPAPRLSETLEAEGGEVETGDADDRSWPCSCCASDNPLARNTCSVCGAGFLSGLSEGQAPLLRVPLVGDITRFSRPQRLMLAGGAVGLLLVPLAALSFFLTPAPPKQEPVPPPGSVQPTVPTPVASP